jgi:lipoate---protein ligase
VIRRALRSEVSDPYRNLALEESLLARGFGGESALLLYANGPCVVVGRNQNPWAEASEGSGLPLLRRVSGGGAVYQDLGNLNWALLTAPARHDREAELALVAGALRELGIDAEAGPRGGLFMAGGGPHGGAKISGTARRLCAEGVLHHGTLLVDADLARMEAGLGGMEIECSRALPSVASPCVNLASLAPGIGVAEVAEALARTLVGSASDAAGAYADAAYADEAERRLRSWDWTWGATPPFSVTARWSGGLAHIEVKKGRVASVSGPGSEAIAGFVGGAFDYDLPRNCVDEMEGRGIPRQFAPRS